MATISLDDSQPAFAVIEHMLPNNPAFSSYAIANDAFVSRIRLRVLLPPLDV